MVTGRKQDDPSDNAETVDDAEEEARDSGVETTADEVEAFHIVKAIVREIVAPERIAHRDTKSYMGILLDDNNRKPICRLHFNASQYYLGVFDAEKNETREPIESLNDIYQYADHLRQAAARYDA